MVNLTRVASVDSNGHVYPELLPGLPAALTLGAGFVTPDWGQAAAFVWAGQMFLFGQVGRDTADFLPGAVLLTGGSWPSGQKFVCVSQAGTVLLHTTATTVEFDRILTGISPTWISLDGSRIPSAT